MSRKVDRNRPGYVHHFKIYAETGTLSLFLTVNYAEQVSIIDEEPAEIFINCAKAGTTMAGLMDTIAILVSHGLQSGMDLYRILHALDGMRYEPMGKTDDGVVSSCSSISDYLAKHLAYVFGVDLDQGVVSR